MINNKKQKMHSLKDKTMQNEGWKEKINYLLGKIEMETDDMSVVSAEIVKDMQGKLADLKQFAEQIKLAKQQGKEEVIEELPEILEEFNEYCVTHEADFKKRKNEVIKLIKEKLT